jgi:hypothetical protein
MTEFELISREAQQILISLCTFHKSPPLPTVIELYWFYRRRTEHGVVHSPPRYVEEGQGLRGNLEFGFENAHGRL